MYTGISFDLHRYIPQHSPQIWDETSKTSINLSILRNTRLRIFDFSLINGHTPLPCFSKPGSLFLSDSKVVALLLCSELAYMNRVTGFTSHGAGSPCETLHGSLGFHQFSLPLKQHPQSASSAETPDVLPLGFEDWQ